MTVEAPARAKKTCAWRQPAFIFQPRKMECKVLKGRSPDSWIVSVLRLPSSKTSGMSSKDPQLQWRGPRRIYTDFPVSPRTFQSLGTFEKMDL